MDDKDMNKGASTAAAEPVNATDHVDHIGEQPDSNPLPWWKQKELRKLYCMTTFLFLASTTLGYDGSLLNGMQTMETWRNYFDDPQGNRLGIFGAVPGFGGLFVLLFAPYIADGIGRKKGTALGCFFVVLGSILQSVPPPSPRVNRDAMYLIGRFIMGFGSNISNGTCPLLITEIAHPRHRGKVTTLYNTLWYLGAIMAAWTCFGTLRGQTGNLQWKIPTGLQCAMPGIQMLTVWLLPESPRWLISKGKEEEAKQMLVKYHANNDEEDEFVRWEYAEISSTLRLERESNGNGWAELWRTKGNRKRSGLIIATAIFSQCSGNGLVSYYLAQVLRTIGITESITQAYINGGLTIWQWLVSLCAAFFVDRIGRRVCFLTAGIGMLVSFSIWTACSAVYEQNESPATGMAVMAMIFVFYGFSGVAWPGLTVSYTVEILPYGIRAKGLTLCFCFTALSGVFNQWVNPLGLQALGWKFYLVYVALLVIQCLIIYFFFVETRGPTLEEIATLFDGEDSAAGLAKAHANTKMEEEAVNRKRSV